MCKFCNYNEGDVADEDIIDERIRIGNIPDALGILRGYRYDRIQMA